ncbi:MAG: hypothetical protein ACLP53_02835 [Isosphaeraceae bacterium]
MMDYIRQLRVAGRRSLGGVLSGDSNRHSRRRSRDSSGEWEALESRELLSTIQHFNPNGGGTSYTLPSRS